MKFYLTQIKIKNKTPPSRTLPTIRASSSLIFYLTQIKIKSRRLSPATHIFNPSFEISVNKKIKLYFYLTQIKFIFRFPSKLSPQGTFAKMKQKCFAYPSEQAKQIQTKIGFALSVCHTVISKVPRHLYSNLKPYCWYPTISVHNPFLRDCP